MYVYGQTVYGLLTIQTTGRQSSNPRMVQSVDTWLATALPVETILDKAHPHGITRASGKPTRVTETWTADQLTRKGERDGGLDDADREALFAAFCREIPEFRHLAPGSPSAWRRWR